MLDHEKTKEKLIEELQELRRSVRRLEYKSREDACQSIENSSLILLKMLDRSNQAYLLLQDGKLEFLNQACVEMFGYSQGECSSLPHMLEKVIHPDDREMVNKYYSYRLRSDTANHRYACRIFCKDGSAKWLDIQSAGLVWNDKLTFLIVATDITQYMQIQSSLQETASTLEERVKELNCLYQIANVVRKPGLSLPGILEKAVNLVREAWKDPEITCAMIRLGGDIYKTPNYAPCAGKQTEAIEVDGAAVGLIEVGYFEEKPENREGSSLKGKRSLITAISEMVGETISSKRSFEELKILEKAIRTSINGIGLAHPHGTVFSVNEAFLRMWGYRSQQEVIGKHISEFLANPNTANELIELLKKGDFVLESTAQKSDGSKFEIQLSMSSVKDDSGNMVCMMGSFLDITEHKLHKELLEASEQRFKIGAQCASDDIYELEVSTDRVSHYGSIYEELGYSQDEIPVTSTAWSKLIHPEDRERVMESFISCLKSEEGHFDEEYRIRRKDGQFNYFVDRAFFLRDESGAPYKLIGALRDITEKRLIEEKLSREAEKLKSILDHMQDGIYIVDKDYNIQYVNPALISERGGLGGRKCYEYLTGGAEPCPWCRIRQVFAGLTFSWERTSVKTGKTYEIFQTPIRNQDSSIVSLMILHDITQHKQMENELRDREQRFQSITASAFDAIILVNHLGEIVFWNAAGERIFGWSSSEAIGKNVHELLAPSRLHAAALAGLEEFNLSGHGNAVGKITELTAVRKNGEEFLIELSLSSFRMHDHWFASGLVRDLTERNKLYQALRSSEERFRQVSANAEEWIWEVDQDGMYTYSSSAVHKILGYSIDEVVGEKYFYDFFLPEEREKLKELAFSEFAENRSFSQFINRNLRKDGAIVTIESSGVAIFDQQGEMIGYRGVDKDITEQVRAEAERLRLVTAIEQTAATVLITGVDGTIEYVNPAFERITGYTSGEVVGKNPRILQSGKHDRAFYLDLWKTISGGKVWTGRLINKTKDGALVYKDGSIAPVRGSDGNIVNYVQVTQDVTKEVELQNQLVQAQKLEAIGTLAGGIAHDFNNILFAITGFTELAMMDLPADSRARSNMERVMQAAKRSGDMVKQILAFSRRGHGEVLSLDLTPLVKEGLKFLRGAIPSTIELRQSIEPNLDKILGDATKIHQVLMNLCINASHAIKDAKGTIAVELSQMGLGPDFTEKNPPLVPGKYVRLRVSDTGSGIAPEIMEKIFDPYFTTKEAGKGTGLGLSVVREIVRSHNGAITLNSGVGKGSTFDVFFPVIEEQWPQVDEKPVADVTPVGKERILVVDDENHLLEMYERQLKRLGYEVTCSSNPEEALELFRGDPRKFDLVITDFTMPKMTGIEFATGLGSIRPGLPIILCSGVSQIVSDSETKKAGIQTVIYKPIRRPEIAQAIRKALDQKP